MSESFEHLCLNWLDKKRVSLKDSSYNKYEYLLKDYIIPELGQLSFSELNMSVLEKALGNIYCSKNHGNLSNSLMKSILYITNAVLGYGRYLGCFKIDNVIFELPSFHEDREIQVLDSTEEARLISYLHENINNNSIGIIICLFTGMRLGEVCALQYRNLDMDKAIFHIRSTVQRIRTKSGKNKTELAVTSPKSKKSIREIPIPTFLLDYFKSYLPTASKEDSYVLGNTSKPYEPRTLQYGFKKVLERSKLEDRNFHSLRHTFATNCIRAGFDVKTLSEILGHSNVNFTLNKYVHSDMEEKRLQMEKLMDIYKQASKIA